MGFGAAMSIFTEIAISLQRRFGRQRLRTLILGSIPFVVLAAVWHMNAVFRWLPEVFIPDIGSVFGSMITLQEECPDIGAALLMERSCEMSNHVFSSLGRVLLAAVGKLSGRSTCLARCPASSPAYG